MLFSGWGSNYKYSLLASLCVASQTISYEIVLIFVSLFPLCLCSSFFLHSFLFYKFLFGVWLFSLYFMWLVSAVAETYRSPFDVSDGERELVSGLCGV